MRSSSKCERFRKIELVGKDNGAKAKVLDSSLSSKRGAWAVHLKKGGPGSDKVFIRTPESKAGDATCKAAKVTVAF